MNAKVRGVKLEMLDVIGANGNVMAMQLNNVMLKMVRACQRKIAQQEMVEEFRGLRGPFWAKKDHFGS